MRVQRSWTSEWVSLTNGRLKWCILSLPWFSTALRGDVILKLGASTRKQWKRSKHSERRTVWHHKSSFAHARACASIWPLSSLPTLSISLQLSPTHKSRFIRVDQNHIYTEYIRYFWQGIHQIYGHIRCIYTVLANPTFLLYANMARHVVWG